MLGKIRRLILLARQPPGCSLPFYSIKRQKSEFVLNKESLHSVDPTIDPIPHESALNWINRFLPALLADLLAFALALWFLPQLSQQFQNLAFFNSVLMGIFFLIFCFSVYGIKKLLPITLSGMTIPSLLLEKRLLSILGVFFALTISAAVAYVVGFLDSVVAINRGLLDEPSVTIYLLLTPASWFGLALIYMLVLSSETEPGVEPSTLRYGIVSLLSLLGINMMGLAFVAVGQAVSARFDTVPASATALLLNLLLFLLLLGPPRLIYTARVRQIIPIASFLLLIAYFAVAAAP